MIRLVLALVALVAAAAAGFVLAEHPGHASLAWGAWRIDTSAAVLAAAGLSASLLLAAALCALAWLMGLPARGARNRGETARRKTHEAIARGYLALAAGDADEADRHARRAAMLDGQPLSHVLAGQAAEARGDDGAAQAAYAHLLNDPDGRAAGQRALRRLALRRGDDLAQDVPIPPEAPLSLGD